jgi:magnesium chelatase subunit I
VARELVRQAVATVFDGYTAQIDSTAVVEWFNRGGSLDLADTMSAADLLRAVDPIEGFGRLMAALGAHKGDPEPVRAAVADFALEGLCALKKISRTEAGRLLGAPTSSPARGRQEARTLEDLMDEDEPAARGKKKYYN